MADLIGRQMVHKLPKWQKDAVRQASLQAKTWPSKYFAGLYIKDRQELGYYVLMHSDDFEDWYGDRILKMLEEDDAKAN